MCKLDIRDINHMWKGADPNFIIILRTSPPIIISLDINVPIIVNKRNRAEDRL